MKKHMETKGLRERRRELFRLMKENPELPVVPMVDGEIPGDDCGWWLGEWGYANVDFYLFSDRGIIFKSDDDVFDTLERFLPENEFDNLPETVEECKPYYDALPWEEAIVVYIGLPEWGKTDD